MNVKNDETESIQLAVAELADALRGSLLAYQESGATFVPRVTESALRSAVQNPSPAEDSRARKAEQTQAQEPPSVGAPALSSHPVASPSAEVSAQDSMAQETKRTDDLLHQLVHRRGENVEKLLTLEKEVIGACRRCKLHRARNRVVFGCGHPSAELVFVGEGPGAEEDRQGIPFVGAAGQLLTRMIEAMGYQRDEVYICNVVKCRPPNNRDPEPDEVHACERFLKAQLAIVKPKIIVTLGKYAAQTLLRSDLSISQLRGQWHRYEGIDLLPTFHPAYLLRSPEKKRDAWQDLQKVMNALAKTNTR